MTVPTADERAAQRALCEPATDEQCADVSHYLDPQPDHLLPGCEQCRRAILLLGGQHTFDKHLLARIAADREELAAIRTAITPVLDWYQSDEIPARTTVEIVTDAVADLQEDRAECLQLRKQLAEREAQIAALHEAAEAYRRAVERYSLFVADVDDEEQKGLRDAAKSARMRLLSVLRDVGALAAQHDAAVAARARREQAERDAQRLEGLEERAERIRSSQWGIPPEQRELLPVVDELLAQAAAIRTAAKEQPR